MATFTPSSAPYRPEGTELAGGKSADGTVAFVTEEPDGLFYVWWSDPGRALGWTYAYKTFDEAIDQLHATLGNAASDDFGAT